jgi:transposase
MALTDGQGLPISVDVTSASPHESKLAEETFNKKSISRNPKRLIADKAYDSKKLRRAFSKKTCRLYCSAKIECQGKDSRRAKTSKIQKALESREVLLLATFF